MFLVIMQCAKVEEKKKFSRCSGCAQTFYCSKECQVEDWKAGYHRETCRQDSGESPFFSQSSPSSVNCVYVSDGRFNNDIPFLHFLANKYVVPKYKALLNSVEYPVEDAIFCLELVPTDFYCTVGISSKDVAATQLRNRSREASNSYRIIDRRSQSPTKSGDPITYIQVIAYEGWGRMVVRYIPLDLKPEYYYHGDNSRLSKADFIDAVRWDIVDDFPDRHRWTCIGQDGKNTHIFDRIDDYIRVNFSKDSSETHS